jgi:hypothetical protein
MDDQGKRVSWVELYLDLVFVLAVAQLAHLIVDEPGDAQRLDRARVVLHAVVDLGGLVFLFSSSRVPGAAARRDVPARAAATRAQPLRIRLAAHRLDGDVRRPQHPCAARRCRGRPRALPRG